MNKNNEPSLRYISKTAEACLNNGIRLLDESYDLEFRKPASTQLFLIMIAQEEFAKAFVCFLVQAKILPLNRGVHRAINDHVCKQLIGFVMDYIIMSWDSIEELEAAIKLDSNAVGLLPNCVGSAVEIFAYEKISRWVLNNWNWADSPNYDRTVLSIAEGKRDRKKQDSLYVRIDKNGRVCSSPDMILPDCVEKELDRAGRYKSLVRELLKDGTYNSGTGRFNKVIEAFAHIFSQSTFCQEVK